MTIEIKTLMTMVGFIMWTKIVLCMQMIDSIYIYAVYLYLYLEYHEKLDNFLVHETRIFEYSFPFRYHHYNLK